MRIRGLQAFAEDRWRSRAGNSTPVRSAITGDVIAEIGSDAIDYGAMLEYARNIGGPALRGMTFHERALMLKGLGQAIMARRRSFTNSLFRPGAHAPTIGSTLKAGPAPSLPMP